MATLVLSAAGAAFGGSAGGTLLGVGAAAIGKAVGATVGSAIDQQLLGQGSRAVEQGRLDTLRLLGAAEGAALPRVFGRMRVPGQVIWATRFREHSSDGSTSKSGARVTQYSYSISLALALCEGEILRIGRVWADGSLISLSETNWRLHRGGEDQMPDDLIKAVEGEAAPAYRGTAYLVLEDFDLAPFGNRVPQFNIEVFRRARAFGDGAVKDTYDAMGGVAMVPGTGEYSLATTPVVYDYGTLTSAYANVNNASGASDLEVSLDQLQSEVPNAKSISLVVSWFGDDLRCGQCQVRPAVEQTQHDGREMPWTVCGTTRAAAHVVSKVENRPAFGGTPCDASVIEAIREMNRRSLDVMFYPFLLMDVPKDNSKPDPWSDEQSQPVFPWRGRITLDAAPGRAGSADKTAAAGADVASFFGVAQVSDFTIGNGTVSYSGPNEWSLRRFILHSAALCKAAGGVSAFCIGSEMRALTQIRDSADHFPAVDAFIALARDVRQILGAGTKISYAADWSEYFGYHAHDGSGDLFFHLDPLWASPDIDFIGIDNYMPLADWRDNDGHLDAGAQSIYELDYLKGNIEGGEGYDWYYASDQARKDQVRTPIADTAYGEHWVFRYKDIARWWSQPHYNRPGGVKAPLPTAWQPRSKPIWFTELGCAAIDKGANQPNVFLDVKSSESNVPYFSNGRRDDFMQYRFLQAHYDYWADPSHNPVSPVYGGPMIAMERTFVWAWDARPWPDFPQRLDMWSDGENYARGHWVSGRTGIATLAGIVSEVADRSDFARYDVRSLSGSVEGFLIAEPQSARQSLQPLMLSHGFDAVEDAGRVRFRNRSGQVDATIRDADLIRSKQAVALEFTRAPEAEIPDEVQVNFYHADKSYQRGSASAGRPRTERSAKSVADLPVAMSSADGAAVTARWLAEVGVARDSVTFTLPQSFAALEAGDVVRLDTENGEGLYRIDRIEDGAGREVAATRIEAAVYSPGRVTDTEDGSVNYALPGPVFVSVLDLPLLSAEGSPTAPYVLATGAPWTGRVAVYSASNDQSYERDVDIVRAATVGTLAEPFAAGQHGLWMRGRPMRLVLETGSLQSRDRLDVLGGANMAALRAPGATEWEIIQFAKAQLVGERTYLLDDLLRGQRGTDPFIPPLYPVGTAFVLLDGGPVQPTLDASGGVLRHYRIGPATRSYADASYKHVTHTSREIGLRPYAPEHVRALILPSGDLLLSWIRRTRKGGDSWQGIDVPLSETIERYRLRIIKDGTVRKELELSAPSFVYATTQMTADGVSAPFDITIAQISEQFGPGPVKRMTYHG